MSVDAKTSNRDERFSRVELMLGREALERLQNSSVTVVGLGEKPFFKRGRVRNTLGSMPTITGMFGLTAANTAIRMLIQTQIDTPTPVHL